MPQNINPETIAPQEYLTVGQLSTYLGWTPRFIDGLVRGEHLPGFEIDGQWRFRRGDVVDWLEQKILDVLKTATSTEEVLAALAEAEAQIASKNRPSI